MGLCRLRIKSLSSADGSCSCSAWDRTVRRRNSIKGDDHEIWKKE